MHISFGTYRKMNEILNSKCRPWQPKKEFQSSNNLCDWKLCDSQGNVREKEKKMNNRHSFINRIYDEGAEKGNFDLKRHKHVNAYSEYNWWKKKTKR